MPQEKTEFAPVEIMDDTGKTILLSQIENTKREITQFTTQLEQNAKEHKNYEEQAVINAQVRKIQKEAFRKTPEHIVWEFEKNPEYWELQDKLLAYKHRQEQAMDEGTFKRYEEVKKNLEESLKREQAKLAEYEKQLSELK